MTRGADLYLAGHPMTLHSGGQGDRLAQHQVARQSVSYHPAHHLAGVDSPLVSAKDKLAVEGGARVCFSNYETNQSPTLAVVSGRPSLGF